MKEMEMFCKSLFDLVYDLGLSSVGRSMRVFIDKMSRISYRRYVPLAYVLERATEEHMVELEGLASELASECGNEFKIPGGVYFTDLSGIISNYLDDVYLYISGPGEVSIAYISYMQQNVHCFNFVDISLVV